MNRFGLLALTCVVAGACARPAPDRAPASPAGAAPDDAPALAALRPEAILDRIRTLASDDFEGRAPGSPGEDRTVRYLTEAFQRMGLRPGCADGTYAQPVPLVESRTKDVSLSAKAGERAVSFAPLDDVVAYTIPPVADLRIDASDLVFVGYGVVAPEYGWDDFKGLDVHGKTLVVLVNDPQVPDPADPTKLDDRVFKGKAMTYYGRYTYKYEEAERRGAAAVLVVHQTDTASYPWSTVRDSWGKRNFALAGASTDRPMLRGWITVDAARRLLSSAGKDFDELQRAALRPDFRPVPLAATASAHLACEVRDVVSHNVVARLEGTDLRAEDVVYTAHWDHLGKDPERQGDGIYNGAVDNASGVAQVMTLAEAFTKLRAPLRRSVVFVALTGEERGLLGSGYYVTHPPMPTDRPIADLNVDGIDVWGKTGSIRNIALGHSTLDELVAQETAAEGRRVLPDQHPERGAFFRSDQLEFLRHGVPAFFMYGGEDYVGRPPGWGEAKTREYIMTRYHQPSDEVDPAWDLSGAVEDARILLRVGERLARGEPAPQWKAGSEFAPKEARDHRNGS